MNNLDKYKFYNVEITHAPTINMVIGEIYSEYAFRKPENKIRHLPKRNIYNAYFSNKANAENYKMAHMASLVTI